ncbi:U11/U12 small nuclear ribonucleoprotein 59 kDa protein [Impatiens glandulifera]|uniref:U11/U12 small nuclear ribonucleoprotein 59 kDa protein n=1 Tax=Impatiens glandulifera TaxID=253017 RepID=UPI001FB0D675|nr:U11/U12 small nuclear ribonucleoprotein 59 kDa protein [Impatiens glandulifera]
MNSQFTGVARPPWIPVLRPVNLPTSGFWNTANVGDCLKELRDTIALAKAVEEELEALVKIKSGGESSAEDSSLLSKFQDDNRINLATQDPLGVEASQALIRNLRAQLEPFRVNTDDASGGWEVKSAAVRFANKMHKWKRNKRWRKKKKIRIAEDVKKERERFDQADQEADEWRAREIANDIARRKVEKMKEIAKLKAKEEKKKLESELELVLIVEKLQELRSIRIQRLTKQGHFLPEEDDKFLERVRAAVEEEERQAKAATDTEAAKDAIATAEETRKITEGHGSELEHNSIYDGIASKHLDTNVSENKNVSCAVKPVIEDQSVKQRPEGHSYGGTYGSNANLPVEFYHYYHGSNTDIGTLIEVRRTWDAYIRPGGSRIPGHFVQPPAPTDEIWASYVVKPK